jgi:hypothetical protein
MSEKFKIKFNEIMEASSVINGRVTWKIMTGDFVTNYA